jgi:predicted PurR-regulated permease PerM
MTSNPTSNGDREVTGTETGWTRRHVIFLSISAAFAVLIVYIAHEILLPFILALVIAYVLTPLVAVCEKHLRLPRSASILLVYAVVLGTLYAGIAATAPRLWRETAGLFREVPTELRRASERIGPQLDAWVDKTFPVAAPEPAPAASGPTAALEIKPGPDGAYSVEIGAGFDVVQVDARRTRIEPHQPAHAGRVRIAKLLAGVNDHFFDYLKANGLQLLKVGRAIVSGTTRAIFLLFMTLMVAGYLMHTREKVIGFFRSMVPPRSRTSFDWLMHRIDRGLSGVVRGQLLICCINGVFAAIGFSMLHLKYWPVMALIAAVGSLIPIFGSIMSAVPAVAIGLTQSFWIGLWTLLWILGVHQLEANFLNPKIIGTAARIHPCLVVFVLITGEHLYGAWGALLAVPLWSLLQSFFQHFRYRSIPDATDTLVPSGR